MREKSLKELIDGSKNIVFFGGAGVSTESNIPDFRSADGLYSAKNSGSYRPEEILSRSFFLSHPEEFYDFYKSKMIYREAKPNDAHFALAKLERAGKLKAVITQNIDGLHQAAGSREVLELHGSVHANHCTRCHKFYGLDRILESDGVPTCGCGGIIKPDVVLYEETLDDEVVEKALEYISHAQILIVGGTSLTVYPAAGLIRYFTGENLVLINKDSTPYDRLAQTVIHGSIGATLKSIAE